MGVGRDCENADARASSRSAALRTSDIDGRLGAAGELGVTRVPPASCLT